jgi:hypothetical protein
VVAVVVVVVAGHEFCIVCLGTWSEHDMSGGFYRCDVADAAEKKQAVLQSLGAFVASYVRCVRTRVRALVRACVCVPVIVTPAQRQTFFRAARRAVVARATNMRTRAFVCAYAVCERVFVLCVHVCCACVCARVWCMCVHVCACVRVCRPRRHAGRLSDPAAGLRRV